MLELFVPTTWTDPEEHRRKLAEAIQLITELLNSTSNRQGDEFISTVDLISLTPKTSDPSIAVGGQIYYNSATGKFRGYNDVTVQWEDLN